MTDLEEALRRRFPNRHILPAGRGTTALYITLVAIRRIAGGGEIVVPTTVCPSVPMTILLAGFQPRFCEVELDSWCASRNTIEQAVNGSTRAVVVVYLFGKAPDIHGICEICRQKGIYVIEDIAQAAGTKVGSQLAGSIGDSAILSFSPKKVLDGNGGAALYADKHLCDEADRVCELLPQAPSTVRLRELAQSFRDLTHGVYGMLRSTGIEDAVSFLGDNVYRFRDLLLRRVSATQVNEGAVVRALNSMESERHRRRVLALKYYDELREATDVVQFESAEMCWRLPLLVDSHELQQSVLRTLRRNGRLVSDHYFPASCLFGVRASESARNIGLRGINLCVEESVSEEVLWATCSELRESVEAYRRQRLAS